jgi:hypothetical protein
MSCPENLRTDHNNFQHCQSCMQVLCWFHGAAPAPGRGPARSHASNHQPMVYFERCISVSRFRCSFASRPELLRIDVGFGSQHFVDMQCHDVGMCSHFTARQDVKHHDIAVSTSARPVKEVYTSTSPCCISLITPRMLCATLLNSLCTRDWSAKHSELGR